MKILVTGASGFIGGALAKKLIEQKTEVRIFVRDSNFDIAGAEKVIGDVTDLDSCMNATEGVDIVVHCAGILGGWGNSDKLLWDANVTGTKNMLDAAKAAKVKKLIYISSCGVFGPLKDGEIADEAHVYNPINTYEKTKIEGEKLVLRYAKDFSTTIIRPEFVYGPGDLHLIALFRAVKEKRFVFFEGGKSMLHPTYINDVIDGIVLAIFNPLANGESFNIAGPRQVTVHEFIAAISEACGTTSLSFSIPIPMAKIAGVFLDLTWGCFAKPPLSSSQVGYLTQNRAFSYEKAKKNLDYMPKIQLKDGIKKTVKWYSNQKLI